jgi:hypothetical protein
MKMLYAGKAEEKRTETGLNRLTTPAFVPSKVFASLNES